MKNLMLSHGRHALAAFAFLFSFCFSIAGGDSPVQGVEVLLESSSGKKMTTVTDRSGKFTFGNLDKGTYTVKVRCKSGACVSAPRDAASGQATGKAAMQDFHFTCTVSAPEKSGRSSSSSLTSPRDASSGLATGKRQHKPMTITKEWSSASTITIEADGSSCTGDISSSVSN